MPRGVPVLFFCIFAAISSEAVYYMGNYNKEAFPLTLIVLLLLLAAHFLPDMSIAGHKLRKVDMLSDLRVKPAAETDAEIPAIDMEGLDAMLADSLPSDPLPSAVPAEPVVEERSPEQIISKHYLIPADTCPPGVTCIEDYSDSLGGMSHFYAALDMVGELDRPVRIAVFGDSFIEGDIFTSDLRQLFQKRFGGSGAGYVDMTSNVAGFRPTVLHKFSGWSSHSAVDTAYHRQCLGPTGHYFVPESGRAWVQLEGTSRYASLCKRGERSYIYYEAPSPDMTLSCSLDNAPADTLRVTRAGRLSQSSVSGDFSTVRWDVCDADSALFFGVSMESRQGVLVDNFTLRGSAGHNIYSVPQKRMKEFASLRPYDLIILEYGLNVASDKVTDYSYYTVSLVKIVKYLKTCFPDVSILIIGVGDRCAKDEYGEYVTMTGVRELAAYQQAAALKSGVCFWNLYEAMSQAGGMPAFVNSEPAKANKDYTHINFLGGREIARMLFDAMMFGKEMYDAH